MIMKTTVLPKLALLLITIAGQVPALAQLTITEKDDIGFTSLQGTLGLAMPTGLGVSASQVEAPEASTYYRPDTSVFTNQSFIFPSGGATGISSHATTVGRYFYGNSSLSPNLGATSAGDQISSWEVNNWLFAGSLKTGTQNALPTVESRDIQSHSWVGTSGNTTTDTEILRRVDFAITRDDFVATYGLNNGVVTLPNLMAGSYNGISVGLSNGSHSYGLTTIDGIGRMKPDIVVPTSATSWATPTVGGAASLLIETARNETSLNNGARHEVVKALLLNGATKDEAEFSRSWTHTETAPLDPIYGAGELNILRSHNNLTAGEFSASTAILAESTGWDLGIASDVTSQLYFFDLPTGYEGAITASLAWDRMVTATDTQQGQSVNYSFESALANLNLHLYQANGFSLATMIDQSVSSVDNVEHLYFQGLQAGRYALSVSSDTLDSSYGLAWNTDLVAIPEPGALMLSGLALALFQRRRRRP